MEHGTQVFTQAGIPLERLTKVLQTQEFRRGEFIYRSLEAPKGIYSVRSGLVGLVLTGPSGKEHLMRFFTSGQVFGHRALIADQNYHATTQALEACVLDFLPKTAATELLDEFPLLYKVIMKQLATELCHCETQQVSVLDQQILPRIARAVVYLKELHPTYRWTRSEIANFCASTTSSVIKALADLEYMGLIKQKGRDIAVLDKNGLIHFQEP